MIPQTSVNWTAFNYKYSTNPQHAFESLTYYLFCHEFQQPYGIFRYFNQPHIETNPIHVGDRYIGFQSKYYADSVTMSSKEQELIDAVKGAAQRYPGITTLYFYISREFSPSSKKDNIMPSYQKKVEAVAEELGIELVWRVPSNLEAQLMQDKQLTICRNVFFQVDSAVQTCCENLEKHKREIFDHIHTSIRYKGNDITLEHTQLNLRSFLNSAMSVLLIDGAAGSGKSALVKQLTNELTGDCAFLAFKSTDLDVNDILNFLTRYGELNLDELIDVYKIADTHVLYIDAAEKFFICEYQETFEDILNRFIAAGWKIILTLRTAYRDSFQNSLLHGSKVQTYQVEPINLDKLSTLSHTYGFQLPQDKRLLDLLCAPFYLGLYLALENLEDESMRSLNREAFEEKIWNDIIRNNRKRKDNLPTRRETVLISLTTKMLQNEIYYHEILAEDDSEALSELEKSGVLFQNDDARRYLHSHDVFEELVVGHIFTERYRHGTLNEQFFADFHPSLRIRKLFRGWLADFAAVPTHQELIFHLLDCEQVNQIWKDEILLTVISTESLKEVYQKLTQKMAANNYELLRKLAILINTCCRAAENWGQYWSTGNLIPFRLSKPSGYAWQALFAFLLEQKETILWDESLISIIIEVLDSWTKHLAHAKSENTRMAGEIGVFLFQKIANDKDLRYTFEKGQVEKLQDVLVNSAWMIQEPLKSLFQMVIDEKTGDENHPPLPRMYTDLAKCAVSDIYHYGMVPAAMPEIALHLMAKLWVRSNMTLRTHYAHPDVEEDFGLNPHLDFWYQTASAYATPIIPLLQTEQNLVTDWLIDFCNQAGNSYAHSSLNEDYGECTNITIYVNDIPVEQIASDRLWKMYRGTSVGPNLLISLLMGFEKWLLMVIEHSETLIVVNYCRYILQKSRNVMLTSVIVSAAEAYPDKLFEIVCELLRTKELFHLDSHRFTAESSASFLLSGKDLLEKERLESNRLPFRKKRLEEVILSYQTNASDLSKEAFDLRKQTLYQAIDRAAADIDTWSSNDKFAYYRMDLRRYQEIVDVQENEHGQTLCTVLPDFTEDMKALSQKSAAAYEPHLKYMDLQLWSDYKFHHDVKFREYKKYEKVRTICSELNEIWAYMDAEVRNEELTSDDISVIVHRFTAIASYTSAVLLRDFKETLSHEDRTLCECIIFSIADLFAHASHFEIVQAGNGIDAIAVGLVLLSNEDNIKAINDENPLCLLLKLALNDWSYNSRIVNGIASTIWVHSQNAAWHFLYLFSLLADSYEDALLKNESFSSDDFFKRNEDVIARALAKDSVDITDFDFSKLQNITIFTLLSLISPQAAEAFKFADATKDLVMELVFTDNRDLRAERRELSGYTINYVSWLADILLHCEQAEQAGLIDAFFKSADLIRNDNSKYLITELIRIQDICGKTDAFWNIWELLKPYLLALSSKPQVSFDDRHPYGLDKVIISYLFGNSPWRSDVHRCAFLPEGNAAFFDDFIDKSGSLKALFYAISRLLYTVGREPYLENGIDWMYKLVTRDPNCQLPLYQQTLYYMEEYVGLFVSRHRMDFRNDVELALKTQTVLEYMVNRGSQIAFFLRELI